MILNWRDDWPLILAFVAIVLVFIAVIVGSDEEKKEWEKFAAAQNCRIVSKSTDSVAPGFGYAGNGVAIMTTIIPGKTGWLCDDGITYYR